jgi:hypothetical protein
MDEHSIDAAQVRRGALFLINIGVPVIVGVVRKESDGALIGAMVGMMLAFADSDAELSGRLRLLAVDAGAIAGGGIVGWLCRDSAAALWPVFVAVTLSVGMAARSGRDPLLAVRHCAIAFIVAAVAPAFEPYLIWYLFGVFALNAASRTIDYLLAGKLPPPAAKPKAPFAQSGWLRYALAFSGAALAALWIGRTLDPVHTIWVVVTTLVVMRPDASASYRHIVERVAGTFAGAAVAWVIAMLFHSVAVIVIVILLVAPFIPLQIANRYWLHAALIALMVLLAHDLTLLGARGGVNLLSERLQDVLLGCAIALVGTAVAFPREAAAELDDLVGSDPPDR